jgi:hypothetical protein
VRRRTWQLLPAVLAWCLVGGTCDRIRSRDIVVELPDDKGGTVCTIEHLRERTDDRLGALGFVDRSGAKRRRAIWEWLPPKGSDAPTLQAGFQVDGRRVVVDVVEMSGGFTESPGYRASRSALVEEYIKLCGRGSVRER